VTVKKEKNGCRPIEPKTGNTVAGICCAILGLLYKDDQAAEISKIRNQLRAETKEKKKEKGAMNETAEQGPKIRT